MLLLVNYFEGGSIMNNEYYELKNRISLYFNMLSAVRRDADTALSTIAYQEVSEAHSGVDSALSDIMGQINFIKKMSTEIIDNIIKFQTQKANAPKKTVDNGTPKKVLNESLEYAHRDCDYGEEFTVFSNISGYGYIIRKYKSGSVLAFYIINPSSGNRVECSRKYFIDHIRNRSEDISIPGVESIFSVKLE